MKLFAGVDIGSTTTKCILLDENKNRKTFNYILTEFDRNVSGEKILDESLRAVGALKEEVVYIVSTGYGRKAFLNANMDIPEIIAHGIGTHFVDPTARTIIDIGGQDSKVIELDEFGTVMKFEMNDKCAAGTGRFFEVLTHRLLGIEMSQLSDLMKQSTHPCTISSMCTIFAESEIISYLSQKVPIADIAAGTGRSIAKRILAMGRSAQISYTEPIVFSGGVANNEAIADIFSELLSKKVTAMRFPQSTAALGAALRAVKEYDAAQNAKN
jgi:predicted CoA-substrate-specific enzyme activase